jgi:hypothetical protein
LMATDLLDFLPGLLSGVAGLKGGRL